MLCLNRNQWQVMNYFQAKTENKTKSISTVSQEPVSNDVAKTKFQQDGFKVPKEAFGPANVVLKEAFKHCKQERHILVTFVPDYGDEITQGKNFNMKLSDRLSTLNQFYRGSQDGHTRDQKNSDKF